MSNCCIKVGAALALCMLAGCGGERGLVDVDYPGQPLEVLEGNLRTAGHPLAGQAQMALAWLREASTVEVLVANLLAHASCPAQGMEAAVESVGFEAMFPSRFTLQLSAAPSEGIRHSLSRLGGQGALAVGWVMSYQDTNGNGRYQSTGEPVLATSLQAGQLVLYLDGALPSDGWAGLPAHVPRGFSVLQREGGQLNVASFPSLSVEPNDPPCP